MREPGRATVMRRDYEAGWLDAINEFCDQIEGRSLRAPQAVYRGPVPDELLSWLARVRENTNRPAGGGRTPDG